MYNNQQSDFETETKKSTELKSDSKYEVSGKSSASPYVSKIYSQNSKLPGSSPIFETKSSEVISVLPQDSVDDVITVNDRRISLSSREQDIFNYTFDTLISKSQGKQKITCCTRVGNIFWFSLNTGVLIVICASGPLFYIKLSFNYIKGILPLQIMFATLGPVAISAPGIWTSMSITKAMRPMPRHKKQIVNHKVSRFTLILRCSRDVFFAIAALASVIPFARISIENNKDNIWLAIISTGDIAITRFLMNFFSIRKLLTYNPVACNLNFNENKGKKILLHMRKQLISSLKNARIYLMDRDLRTRRKAFSLRYKNCEDLISEGKIAAAIDMLQQLLEIGLQNRSVLDKRQICCLNTGKWIGNIAAGIGGLAATVGLAGFSVKTFDAVALITNSIENEVLATILQFAGTAFSMSPFYYLVWYKGKETTATLYNFIPSFVTCKCKKMFQNNLPLKLYPKLTLALINIAMFISFLSWASNVTIINECFSGLTARILGLFSILTWITFTLSSMITGVINPVILWLAKYSCNLDTKEKVKLITETLDVFIDTIKKMPLDGILQILKNLRDEIITALLNGKMEKEAFDDLFAKIVTYNEQINKHSTENELVSTVDIKSTSDDKNILPRSHSSSYSPTLFQSAQEIKNKIRPKTHGVTTLDATDNLKNSDKSNQPKRCGLM